jgi:RNA polymerase sigma factor (sigma-70 family)
MASSLQSDAAGGAGPTFEDLYRLARSYLPEALRLLRVPPGDVDDLIHDVVLIARRGLDRFEPRCGRRGEVDASRSLKAWLSVIAWRQVVKRSRRAHRRFELLQGEGPLPFPLAVDEAPSSEHVVSEAQRRRILARVLAHLGPDRAEVLIMHAVLEMSASDVARELGLKENTVKSRLGRARADAAVEVSRLSLDEQRALDGCALLLPLGLDGSGNAPVASGPTPRLTLLHFAGAAGMLAMGLMLGAGTAGRGPRDADHAIAATREAAPAAPEAVSSPAAPALRVGGPPGAAPAGGAAARGAARTAPGDTLARERAWIAEARRALHQGDLPGALAALDAHQQAFARGELAGDRDWLRARVRAALARTAVPAASGAARSTRR